MKQVILLLIFCLSGLAYAKQPIDSILAEADAVEYVCQPCPHVADIYQSETYKHDGQCPICGMNLIEKHERNLSKGTLIHKGSGNYFIAGGKGHPERLINVFYHVPANFSSSSPILIVVPGAGRNAWSYRDSWVEASEKYGVMIVSPAYAERDYDFAAYHLGGLVTNLELRHVEGMHKGAELKKYRLKDEDIVFTRNPDSASWLFEDFDRLFDDLVRATGSIQKGYDIFGHSAGGQILHRLALFKPDSKADRIVAANSGFYTLPVDSSGLPFGIKDTGLTHPQLSKAFSTKLTLLLGEDDNEHETRGKMLHTPLVDQQGLGRLSRGQYFYTESRNKARELNTPFNWTVQIVENVGHDFRLMGNAAAAYLYQ